MGDIAFYAPLKPPDHPVPSGDRTMARNLIRAIETGLRRPVRVVSDLRTRDAQGDAATQAALIARADIEIDRLVPELRGQVSIWVTYHNYYKAPDLLGPAIATALNVPYVLVEATRARKRLVGPWAEFARRAEAASDRAAVIFHLTERDSETLQRDRCNGQSLVHLRPFLPVNAVPDAGGGGTGLLTVAMMREGDKLASYRVLAEALSALHTPDWRLVIVGDGPARGAVEALMRPFGERVHFAGARVGDDLQAAYRAAGVFVWPGVNEAFGMAYLEAQAAGLPVAAQSRPGVTDVLLSGDNPSPEAGPGALATRIDGLLGDPTRRKAEGRAARARVAQAHLLPQAARTLAQTLQPLMEPAA